LPGLLSSTRRSLNRWASGQLIFGKPALLGQPWAAIDPIMIAPPISLIVMVAMQYMGKPFKGNPVPAT